MTIKTANTFFFLTQAAGAHSEFSLGLGSSFIELAGRQVCCCGKVVFVLLLICKLRRAFDQNRRLLDM